MGIKHVGRRKGSLRANDDISAKKFKYTIHHGGSFKSPPYRYEGVEVEVVDTGDYFSEWITFINFMRRRGLKYVHTVYVGLSDVLVGPNSVRLIWDMESTWMAVLLLMDKRELVLYCKGGEGQSIYDPELPNIADDWSDLEKVYGEDDDVQTETVEGEDDDVHTETVEGGDYNVQAEIVEGGEVKGVKVDIEKVEGQNMEDDCQDADYMYMNSENEEPSESVSLVGEDESRDDEVDGYDTEYMNSDSSFDIEIEGDKGDVDDEANLCFKRAQFPKYIPGTSIEFIVGMRFDSREQFKELATAYAVAHHRDIHISKADTSSAEVSCVEGCPFHVWASYCKKLGCFQIKVVKNIHLCNFRYELRLATAKWLAKRFFTKLRDAPAMGRKALKELVKKNTQLHITLHMAKYVKKEFMKNLASPDYEFSFLRDYAVELMRTNPGSNVVLKTKVASDGLSATFVRIYICFEACKRGFIDGCRRVVGIDGCFLKSVVKGEMLTAVGRDANDQMFPIAWAIVEVENKSSWLWFINFLKHDLGIGEGGDWVISSDQQKGLMPAVASLLPNVEHRLCARHICANWQKNFPDDEFKEMFRKCADATNETDFKNALAVIDLYPGAKEALLMVDPKQWAKAFFTKNVKCDTNKNNLCEAFNGVDVILNARTKPIFSMLEDIRKYIMQRFGEKRAFQNRWSNAFGDKILTKLKKSTENHHKWKVIFNGDHGYEVEKYGIQHAVKLDSRSCTCGSWDISGIPCVHAACCIIERRESLEQYLDECYKIDKFAAAYKYSLQPIVGPNMWHTGLGIPITPPVHRRLPGRPKYKRIRGADEKRKEKTTERVTKTGSVNTCSICRLPGHNKRKCPLKVGHASQGGSQTSIPTATEKGRGGKKRKLEAEAVEGQQKIGESSRRTKLTPRRGATSDAQMVIDNMLVKQ